MTSLFDHYLLFRLRTKHDEQAFASLYDRYVTSIYRFVFLKLPSKEMAEDVTAETFLRCWQYVQNQQNTIQNFRAFLYRIARNLVVDAYRKQAITEKVVDPVTFHGSDTSTDVGLITDPSDRSRGLALIEARADLSLMLDRLSKLKEDYRDVLLLRLVDGLSFGDIAIVLEKTSGNVRVIYHRAMKALDTLL
ncbi:MAG: RNA polymerase sigma factor [Candidatus Uhrbacteria bacterium]|nr:RNA polymerase sigma factor [Candidatus Uhrbacteria bacterium]MDP3794093.1 RNA polymerase sigma factor [Candidatus Uhrbacteria bacterium]